MTPIDSQKQANSIINPCPQCSGDGLARYGNGGSICYEFDCEECGGTGDADNYDSKVATEWHIRSVQSRIDEVRDHLRNRAIAHDKSKLGPVEKPIFDEMTPLLKTLEYGSDEYKSSMKSLGPALEHHYANNSHHPEHYQNGINGMCLLDMIEMLCDWRAASERTKGGYDPKKFRKSLEINRDRFKIEHQTYTILENTALRLGYITHCI